MKLKEFLKEELKNDCLGEHIEFLEELYLKYETQKEDFADVIPVSEMNNDKPQDMKLWKEYLEWEKSQK